MNLIMYSLYDGFLKRSFDLGLEFSPLGCFWSACETIQESKCKNFKKYPPQHTTQQHTYLVIVGNPLPLSPGGLVDPLALFELVISESQHLCSNVRILNPASFLQEITNNDEPCSLLSKKLCALTPPFDSFVIPTI